MLLSATLTKLRPEKLKRIKERATFALNLILRQFILLYVSSFPVGESDGSKFMTGIPILKASI